jgi:hypothetical protein
MIWHGYWGKGLCPEIPADGPPKTKTGPRVLPPLGALPSRPTSFGKKSG